MPNLDNSVQLSETYSVLASSYGYQQLSGVDDTRSHKSQLIFLYRYATLADGTAVADVTWKNWYDPFIIPENLITINQAISDVQVGDTTGTLLVDAAGNTYNMPAFTLGGGQIFEIQRSQDVDNRVVIFGAGSRVTAQGLNNAVDQLFKSVQELDSRTTIVESGDTQGGGGGGTTVTPGNYGDVIVGQDGSFTVVDDSHDHVITNIDGLTAALASKLTGIVAGTNVTVVDNSDGTFTINASGSTGGGIAEAPNDGQQYARESEAWQVVTSTSGIAEAPNDGQQYARESEGWSVVTGTSGAPPELTSNLTVTDAVGPDQTVGQLYTSGTDLEVIIRDMLVSYQVPSFSGLSSLASEIEVGSLYNITTVGFNTTNTENIQTAATLRFRRGSSTLNTQNLTLTSGTGTVSQSGTFSPAVSGTYTITGTDNSQDYSIRLGGTSTQNQSRTSSETITVKYRSFAFPSTSTTSGGAISDITSGNDDLTTSTNVNFTATGTASGGNYSWLAFPVAYFSSTPDINVTDTSTGFAAAHNYIGNENYTNAQGTVVSMALFRSPFADSITSGTILDVD